MANNTVLLFLDDDIEPSAGLVQAHAEAHTDYNKVIIGYLPFPLAPNADFYHIKLWSWWEGKFYSMHNAGYRYNFEDLLSGNFSVSSELFKKVKGFNASFRCREDYEL